MKKNALKSTLIILGLFTAQSFVTSCSKEGDEPMDQTEEIGLSEEEAVEIMEASLQVNTGGLSSKTMDISQALNGDIDFEFELTCDTPLEEVFPFQFESNNIQANYMVSWNYEIACNGANVPQTAEFETSSSGSYSTRNIVSDDSTSATLSVSGLQPSATAYLYTGSYNQNGFQSTSFNDIERSFTSSFTASLTSLVVSKSDYRIASGEGMATLVVSNGEVSETFEGSIVFMGGGQATLTLNGTEYTISL